MRFSPSDAPVRDLRGGVRREAMRLRTEEPTRENRTSFVQDPVELDSSLTL
jgi:hypothetical protein